MKITAAMMKTPVQELTDEELVACFRGEYSDAQRVVDLRVELIERLTRMRRACEAVLVWIRGMKIVKGGIRESLYLQVQRALQPRQ